MLKQLKIFSLLFLFGAFSASLSSCDFVYEDEGDCRSTYRVHFVYDMNLKWADAFPSEVHSVNLYIFDEKGVFVKEFAQSGEQLDQPGFCIEFNDETILPGKYTLLAWCQNDNTKAGTSFTVPTPVAGVTTLEEMTCTLNTLSNEQYPEYSDTQLAFLYHGMEEVEFPAIHEGLTYDYTVSLTKDTNHIRIMLQERSSDIDESDYKMMIVSNNGRLGYNNQPLPGFPDVTYLTWALTPDQIGIIGDESLTYRYGLIGDFSTSRLMASESEDLFLTIIKTDTEETIATVPVTEYALLARKYYEEAYNKKMSDQEFLDRKDEYEMTFILQDGRWVETQIEILSWRLVLKNYDLN